MSTDVFKKIVFDLEIDEDGYPPVSFETLNAKALEEGKFQLENTPFFAKGVSLGDIVSADLVSNSDGRYWMNEVLIPSDNKSISIIFTGMSSSEQVFQKLKTLGCYCEYGEFGSLKMLAVSVPPDCDYGLVFDYLENLEEAEALSFAELAV